MFHLFSQGILTYNINKELSKKEHITASLGQGLWYFRVDNRICYYKMDFKSNRNWRAHN